MRYPVMKLCCMLLAVEGFVNSAAAETSRERVALSLSGPDCPSQRLSIRAALTQIPGVSYVDLESVPDHVLVDVTQGDVMPEELRVAAAGTMTSGTQCLVDIMKSCISASLPSPQH
jgi:hypothetical protein